MDGKPERNGNREKHDSVHWDRSTCSSWNNPYVAASGNQTNAIEHSKTAGTFQEFGCRLNTAIYVLTRSESGIRPMQSGHEQSPEGSRREKWNRPVHQVWNVAATSSID